MENKIKASHLRLGNLIYDTKGEVNTVDLTALKYILDYNGIYQAKGIELTEEWLERFGLIKRYLDNPFEEGGFDLKEDGNKWYSWVDKGVFNLEIQSDGEIWFELYSHYRHIKHVQELQNLYHALTEKELTLKP